MKIAIVYAVIVLFLVAACTGGPSAISGAGVVDVPKDNEAEPEKIDDIPGETIEVTETVREVKEIEEESEQTSTASVATPTKAVKETIYNTANPLSFALKETEKLESYSYEMRTNFLGEYRVEVFGDQRRILLETPTELEDFGHIDTIYYTEGDINAVFVCLGERITQRNKYLCDDNKGNIYTAYVGPYKQQVPAAWLDQFRSASEQEVKKGKSYQNRATAEISFEQNGKEYALNVDEFSMLPIRVAVDNTEMQYYKTLAINNVDDDDMVAPQTQ